MGADFLLKGSPLLLQELREFMLRALGFGDFVFRRSDGSEVARAADLRGLEEKLATVPEESISFHAARNHFSAGSRRAPSSPWPTSCGRAASPTSRTSRRCART